jgi:hypothetical protein
VISSRRRSVSFAGADGRLELGLLGPDAARGGRAGVRPVVEFSMTSKVCDDFAVPHIDMRMDFSA